MLSGTHVAAIVVMKNAAAAGMQLHIDMTAHVARFLSFLLNFFYRPTVLCGRLC